MKKMIATTITMMTIITTTMSPDIIK